MKKPLLFLFISTSLCASAQQKFQPKLKMQSDGPPASQKVKLKTITLGANGSQYNKAAKTTDLNSCWFNYFRQIATDSGGEFFWNTYQDTTIIDNSEYSFTGPGTAMFFTGFGVSFDPTDSAYSYNAVTPNVLTTPPGFVVTNNDSYEIDSIYIEGQYMYSKNYTDSLILEMAIVPNTGVITYNSNGTVNNVNNTGTYLLQTKAGYNTTPSYSENNPPRMANINYDPSDQLAANISTNKVRYAIALSPSDTLSSGNTYLFEISPGFQVQAGAKVVAYAHFKSGHTYPDGTTIDNANYFRFYAGDPTLNQFPPQSAPNPATGYPGSFQAGLLGDSYAMYEPPYWISGRRMLVPNFQFVDPNGLDAPDWGFFIKCNSCAALGVANINKSMSSNAYPNPANTELYIPFTLSTPADVIITLTSTLGQTVRSEEIHNVASGKASFDTGNLGDGIYFYIINGGGQSISGRVVIKH